MTEQNSRPVEGFSPLIVSDHRGARLINRAAIVRGTYCQAGTVASGALGHSVLHLEYSDGLSDRLTGVEADLVMEALAHPTASGVQRLVISRPNLP